MEQEINIDLIDEDLIDVNLIDEETLQLELANDVIVGTTKDYNKLDNKPAINSVTLQGNKTLGELGIQKEGDYPDTKVTNLEIDELF